MNRIFDLNENKFDELTERLDGIILDHIVEEYTDYSKASPATRQSPAEGGYWASWESKFNKKILEDITGIRNLTKDEIVEYIYEVIDLNDGELADEFIHSCSNAKLTELKFEVDVKENDIIFEISNTEYEEYEREDY